MKYMLVFFIILSSTIVFESRKERITKKVTNENLIEKQNDAAELRKLRTDHFNLKKDYENLQKQLESANQGQIHWGTKARECFKERDDCRTRCPQ
jgi:hypothetical protein